MSSVSNGLYFLTLPLVSVMRVIYRKIRHSHYPYTKRNVEKVWGARYLSKNTVFRSFDDVKKRVYIFLSLLPFAFRQISTQARFNCSTIAVMWMFQVYVTTHSVTALRSVPTVVYRQDLDCIRPQAVTPYQGRSVFSSIVFQHQLTYWGQ